MVAKRAVVGVFLNSHDLQGIVPKTPDAWQHVLGKGHICVDLQVH